MRCLSCGFENPDAMNFCGKCAAPLVAKCANCGFENPPGLAFCGRCSTALGDESSSAALKQFAPRAASKPSRGVAGLNLPEAERIWDGERKTVTTLFADIKGSMELMEDLDPEEARAIIDPALQLMMEAVRRYDGHVAQSTGDGIFGLFGAPIAHEDHPQRALYAALKIRSDLASFGDRLRRDGRAPVQIRIGLNTGEVVVRTVRKDEAHADYLPIGHSTGLAERMQAIARPDTIVVSEHTHKLTEGYFQFKALGPTKVKGLSEPINVYEVLGIGPLRTRLQVSARRGLSKFVGRQAEMEEMKRALEASKAARGQVVAVAGEPGVGKSRLFHEFKAIARSGSLVLETFSVSHGKASAYLPIIELLKGYFQISLEDDERRRREKIAGKVVILDRALEDALPYIFALLGASTPDSPLAQMDPQVRRRRTLEAIRRLLLRESLNQTVIIIFEDLHWIDDESQSFLNRLADSLGAARLLLLVNYRPEYRDEWGDKSYYTQLRLDPLGADKAEELLAALLGNAPELHPLKQLIIDKTEGNPFFIEEIVRALFDQGLIAGDGEVRLAAPLSEIAIPRTVQAILASRIDRLEATHKELLQTLSVLGREFTLSLVERVTGLSDGDLQRPLSNLQLAEFVFEQPGSADIGYTFKHALTQEVAYGSMLTERRKQLHERAAAAIETLYADRLEDHLSELAHHYSRSGDSGKAFEYLLRAGMQAGERSAFSEAISCLTGGLELLSRQGDDQNRAMRELILLSSLSQYYIAAKGQAAPELERAASRARELCERLGEGTELNMFFALLELWTYRSAKRELFGTREVGDQMRALAERTRDPLMLAVAYLARGLPLFLQGNLTEARELLDKSVSLSDSLRSSPVFNFVSFLMDMPVGVRCLCGSLLWFLGYPDKAVMIAHEALAMAEELARPWPLVFTLVNLCYIDIYLRDGHKVQQRAEQAIALATEHGFPLELGEAICRRGAALALLGNFDEAVAELNRGIAAIEATGAAVDTTMTTALAEALGRAGRPAQGLELLEQLIATLETAGERVAESDIRRLKGELLLMRNPDDLQRAESCFRDAIAVGRRQCGKSLELRAAISLGRLMQKQGRRAEARAVLTETYNWFTEGFETADLKDAKALLARLAG